MKKNIFLTLFLSFFLYSACQSEQSKISEKQQYDIGYSQNILVFSEGNVTIKRSGWSQDFPASFGAILQRGDQVIVAKDAAATILCNNLNLWVLPANQRTGVSNGCPAVPILSVNRKAGNIIKPRGNQDPSLPYVIHPRGTYILTNQPIIQWNPIPSTKTYKISVFGEGLNWTKQVEDTKTQYFGQPTLRPGVAYVVHIEAENGIISDDSEPGIGFILLNPQEADQIIEGTNLIRSIGLSWEASTYAIAIYYKEHKLFSEAILILEDFIQHNSQTAAIQLLYGDLLLQIGLNSQAQVAFNTALELALIDQNIENQYFALVGLSFTYFGLGDKNEAKNSLLLARDLVGLLGDEKKIQEIDNQLLMLEP